MDDISFAFKGVIFDMDGTLTLPALDFSEMRRELGIPSGDLATAIAEWPETERQRAWACIERHEAEAREAMELQDGAVPLLRDLRRAGVRVGVLTRNTAETVAHLAETFDVAFDVVVDRAFHSMKPDPGPLLHILETWKIPAGEAVMIGDYADDVACARAAHVRSVFYQNPDMPFHGEGADAVVHSMHELRELLVRG